MKDGGFLQGVRRRGMMLAAALVLLGAAGTAEAQIVRNFTSRYTTTDRGNFVFVGNTLMTCPDASPACANARIQAGSVTNNQDFTMVPVDVDTVEPGANSSSATLTLPPGSTVKYAALYWGATSSSAARNIAKLRTPASASYNTLTAGQLDVSGTAYHAFADVTSLVTAGGSGVYTVADVKATTGSNTYAGWGLVVVYADSTESPHNVTLFDGFASVQSGGGGASTTVSGFVTPPSGTVHTTVGLLAYEGDFSNPGDSFRVNGIALTNALNAANNMFNSTISNVGVHVTAKTPHYLNQLGFDIDSVEATGSIPNSATSAALQFSPGSDNYLPGVLAFSTAIFQPVLAPTFVKSVTDVNGGLVTPGDVLEYVVSVSNTGNDTADAVVLRDAIPSNTTYVAGSLSVLTGANAGGKSDAPGDDQAEYDSLNNRVVFRLGTGAAAATGGSLPPAASTSIRFRVVIGAGTANGTSITNSAGITYTENQLGGTQSITSNTVTSTIALPDLTIAKSHSGSFVRGSTGSYSLVVSNAGLGATLGTVTVSDTLPAGLTPTTAAGTGWSCGIASQTVTCTRGDALAASASYSAISIGVSVSQAAAASVTNTAAVSGGSETNTGNNSSSDVTAIVSSANLSVTKTGPGTAIAGGTVVYTVTVTNNGPSNAAGVSVADPTPANLSFVSNAGACTTAYPCALGALASGASAVITTTYSLPGNYSTPATITNTATASATTPDPTAANNSATATTPVTPSTDLSISKTGPASVTAGNNVVYTVAVSNIGGLSAANVTVSDPTPAGLTFVSNSGACTTAYPCSLGTLAASATATITTTYAVPSSYTTPIPIVNTASVSTTTTDHGSGNNSSTANTPVTRSADVAITKTGPASVTTGTNLVYTVVVTNNGASDAAGVTVSDPTPMGLTFVSNTGHCTTAYPCSLGTVPAGATRTITSTYTVPSSYTTPNPIVNTASVATTTTDPTPGNNSASASTPVLTRADLAITKTGPPTVVAGNNLVYTVVVTNNGTSDAAGVTVSDPTPTGLSFVSNAGHCTTAYPCSLGTVPAGATRTITSTYTVPSSYTTPNPIVNTASVATTTTDPTPGNNSASASTPVLTRADLAITKTGPPTVVAGNNLVYTVVITNNGTSDATSVSVADPTPPGLTFVSNTGHCTTAYPCSLGTVPAGATRTITSTYTVPASYTSPDPIVNTATLSTTTPDPVAGNDSDTASTALLTSADLTITKTGPASVVSGTSLVYTIVVTNDGVSNAQAVEVTNPTPAGLVFHSNSGDCTTPFPCTLGTLAPGATATITTTFSVPASYLTPDPIVNTATVSSTTSDPDGDDNSATESTPVGQSADVSIIKLGPNAVLQGSNLVYTVVVSNDGDSDAANVSVADPTPPGLTFVSNTGDCTTAYPCALGTLAPNEQRTITTTYFVPGAYTTPDPIVNTATVSTSTSDPVPANDSDSISTAITIVDADLSIVKSGPAAAVPGTNLVYTLVVNNGGPDTASNAEVSDLTPPDLIFVSNTGACTTAFPCSLGNLASGATRTITTTFSVPASYTTPDPIESIAFVTSDAGDSNGANNASIVETPVAPEADLSLAKSGPPTVVAGGSLIYTIVVTNNGASDAAGVAVADPTPAGLTFVSNAGHCSTAFPCDLGLVEAGGTRTITTTFAVPSSYVPTGPIENVATVSAATTDPDGSDNSDTVSTTVTASADLAIDKTAPASVTPGQNLVYTVTLTNNGLSDAEGVSIANPTPTGLGFVSNTGDCATSFPCALGTVPAGATRTITSTFSVPPGYLTPDPIVNAATASATTSDPNNANDSDSTSTAVMPSADLSIVKTGPASATPGEEVVYTIVVTNDGSSDAAGVSVADPTPAGLGFVSNTGDCTTAFPCVLGTVTAGSTRTITATYSVPASYTTPDPIENTATVSTTTNDPTPGNDSSTASTPVSASADLRLDKSGPPAVNAGDQIVYTVSVTNDGISDAQAVLVADPTPAGLTFVSNTGDCTTAYPCALGTVADGETRTITSTYSVSPGYVVPGPIVNTATVSSSTSDPDGSNDSDSLSTTVTASADVSVAKTDATDPVELDTDEVYTITVSNAGPSNATGVVVTDTIDPATTFVSSTGACVNTMGTLTCSVGALAAGASTSFTVTVHVSDTAPTNGTLQAGPCNGTEDLCNNVSVTAAQSDPDPADNSDSEPTDVEPLSVEGLRLAVTDSPDAVLAGSTLTYVLTYSNVGAATITNANLTVTYAGATTFASATPSPTMGDGFWSLGSLLPGQVGQITVTVNISALSAGGATLLLGAELNGTHAVPAQADEETRVRTNAPDHAALAVEKTVAPSSTYSGGLLTYTITVTNDGPATAYDVVVSDPLPAGVDYLNADPAPDTVAGNDIAWSIGDVASGESFAFVVYAETSNALVRGTLLENAAFAEGMPGAGTIASAGLLAEGSVVASVTGASPDCRVVARLRSMGIAQPDGEFVYRLLWNDPCENIPGAVLTHDLPPGLAFVSLSSANVAGYTIENGGTRVVMDVGDVQRGRVGAAFVRAHVDAGLAPGSDLTSTSSLDDAAGRSFGSTDTSTVRAQDAILMTRSFLRVTGPVRVIAGKTPGYVVRYRDVPPNTAVQVSVVGGYSPFSFRPSPTSFSSPAPDGSSTWTWTGLEGRGTLRMKGTAHFEGPAEGGNVISIDATAFGADGKPIVKAGRDAGVLGRGQVLASTTAHKGKAMLKTQHFARGGSTAAVRMRYRKIVGSPIATMNLPSFLTPFYFFPEEPASSEDNAFQWDVLPEGKGVLKVKMTIDDSIHEQESLAVGATVTDDFGTIVIERAKGAP